MSDAPAGPGELHARIAALLPGDPDERALIVAARERLDGVLDLIGQGRGIREAGSGLNPASAELLVADALLTDAALRAAVDDSFDAILPLLELERLSERSRLLDEGAA